jgi:hypothetical protein
MSLDAMPHVTRALRSILRRCCGAGAGALTPYAAGAALSAGSALAPALMSAFNLTVHTVNLGEHVFGPGLHLQVG